MRRLFVLVCCALVAWIALRLALGSGGRSTARDSVQPALVTPAPAAAHDDATTKLERSTEERVAPRSRAGQARIFGRVVDESNRALPDAFVWVFAVDGEWKDGVALPPLVVRGGLAHAFSAVCASDGSFEISAPAPTGRRLRLEVETQDHRGHLFKDVVDKLDPSRAVIHEGENDLGDLVVPVRGAILGRVRLDDGAPVRGAAVDVVGADPSLFVPVCTTDVDGTFVLSCVPAGTCTVGAMDPDVGTARVEDVVLAPGQRIEGLELVIRRARTLSGVVVESDGTPVISRMVEGCVESSAGRAQARASAWTKIDGTFTMLLQDDEPLFLRCGGGAFAKWTSLDTARPWFRPGASGIRIHLTRLATSDVTVLDARTRAPIEVFGLDDLPAVRDTDEPLSPPSLQHHDAGRATILVQIPPQRIVVWARGYEPRIQQLSAAPEQVVLLDLLGSVRGRLSRDGAPFAKARVVARPLGVDLRSASYFGESMRDQPLGRHPGNEQQRGTVERQNWYARVDAEGEFEFTQLDSGAWELLAIEDGSDVLRRLVPKLTLQHAEALDVGTLDFPSGHTSVLLRVLVDEPLQVRDVMELIHVSLNGASLRPFADRPDASGWHVSGLAPGDLGVRVGSNAAAIGELAKIYATLREGEESTVDIDLRGLDLCRLTVRIDAAAEHERMEIYVTPDGGTGSPEFAHWSRSHSRPVTLVVRGGQRVLIAAGPERSSINLKEIPKLPHTTLELPARGAIEATLRVR